jgi:uncharacterized protein Yka (UPF0111/DUF47 family)|tara:strand:- start:46 stop:303 length:258 start_codon:yes stop_codon:yes gene_type:complete
MSDFDFGFTAVDEDELEVVQKASASAESNASQVNKLENKVDKIYNAVLPLLSNLKKNPEKDYIYWPNRNLKIDQFEVVLQKIINE